MLFLSEDEFRRLLTLDDVIAAVRSAFTRDFSAALRMPVRTTLPLHGALLLIMPCYDSALNAAGVKLVSVSEKAGVNAVYELLDPATGSPLARMEANYLTDMRTAATSAVATDLLARQDVSTLGVFGSGREAAAHFAAMSRVRRFTRFLVCGSGRSDVRPFCERIKAEQGVSLETVSAEACAREADVICTCTSAREPLFNGAWLRPGTHLNLIGAFQPQDREVDDETMKRARIVVDTYDGALVEAGDLLIPLNNGSIRRSHVVAELHEIASGKKAGRTSHDDITVFKSVGCALEDLVTALAAYRKSAALEKAGAPQASGSVR
jgi:ornithine cyclodeaminase/alanine dehydrogenase